MRMSAMPVCALLAGVMAGISTAEIPPYVAPTHGYNSSKLLYVVQDGKAPTNDDRLFIQSL